MKLLESIKRPCYRCPYAQGEVQFMDCPCPRCKANNYQMYHVLTKNKYKRKVSTK